MEKTRSEVVIRKRLAIDRLDASYRLTSLRLESHRSGLLLVDLQKKLCPAIEGIESVNARSHSGLR